MRPQPGNRFRFRLRARVVRASEAVRDDSAVAGGRQTFFSSCGCSSSCSWRADGPGRPAGRPAGRRAGRRVGRCVGRRTGRRAGHRVWHVPCKKKRLRRARKLFNRLLVTSR